MDLRIQVRALAPKPYLSISFAQPRLECETAIAWTLSPPPLPVKLRAYVAGFLGGGSGSAGTLPIRCGYLPSPATGLPGSPRSLNLVGIHTRTVQMQCCLDRLSVGPGLQHIAVSPHSRGAEAAVREGNGFLLGPPRDTLQ